MSILKNPKNKKSEICVTLEMAEENKRLFSCDVEEGNIRRVNFCKDFEDLKDISEYQNHHKQMLEEVRHFNNSNL